MFFLSLMSAMEIALQHMKLILLEKEAHTSCHVMTNVRLSNRRFKSEHTHTHTERVDIGKYTSTKPLQRRNRWLYTEVSCAILFLYDVRLSQKEVMSSLKMNPWLDPWHANMSVTSETRLQLF